MQRVFSIFVFKHTDFLISKDLSFLDSFVENAKVKLIFSEELFAEFISVAERPKFKKFFTPKDIKG